MNGNQFVTDRLRPSPYPAGLSAQDIQAAAEYLGVQESPVGLSGFHCRNWDLSNHGQPPVILNPSADVHMCIAWCWGEAREAQDISLAAQHGELDRDVVDSLIAVVHHRLLVLAQMLEALAERTKPPVERPDGMQGATGFRPA